MKKLLTILAVVSLLTSSANAACDTDVCPAKPKVNGTISSTLSKVTGMNWMLSSILEGQIKKQMDKELSADFDVNVEPFGGKSLLEGKFKKFSAYAKSASVDGYYLSDVKAESLCDYNHFIYKNGKVYTNENFVISYSAVVTQSDLQKMVSSEHYQKNLKSMSLSVGKVSLFKLYDSEAKIVNNRLQFSVKAKSPLTLGEPVKLTSTMGIEVENGKLIATDVSTSPNLASANLAPLLPVINKLNPFVYKTELSKTMQGTIKVQDFKIENNKINIKGLVIVPKNYYNN